MMERFKWYRRFVGGIWFKNSYLDSINGERYCKWERDSKKSDFSWGAETVKKEVY